MVRYASTKLQTHTAEGGRIHMKKFVAVLTVVVMVVSLVSLVFAGEKCTVKSVDAKAGTAVLTNEGGKDVTVKADKGVDLATVKAGDKVEATIEKDMLKSVKAAAAAAPAAPAAKPKAAVGC
jgi:hypothetical protein